MVRLQNPPNWRNPWNYTKSMIFNFFSKTCSFFSPRKNQSSCSISWTVILPEPSPCARCVRSPTDHRHGTAIPAKWRRAFAPSAASSLLIHRSIQRRRSLLKNKDRIQPTKSGRKIVEWWKKGGKKGSKKKLYTDHNEATKYIEVFDVPQQKENICSVIWS